MVTKKVMEGAGRKTVDRDLEAIAIGAADDEVYQEVVRAICEGKEFTAFDISHPARALAGVWD